jgi:uncharacterized protein
MGILIAGGSGLIGSELTKYLQDLGYVVKTLTRQKTNEAKLYFHWDIDRQYIDPKAWDGITTVINLAGSSIIGGRWTLGKKAELTHSRVATSKLLTTYINNNNTTVEHYIQGSAMGYYGCRKNDIITEQTPAGTDFMANLCVAWENASSTLNPTIKRSVIRIGLYLSKSGGVYKSISTLTKFYAASGFGSETIWANYTHKDELNTLVLALIKNKIPADTYNAVGANPFTMDQLIAAIAHNENRKVILPNVPAFLLKLVLGEASATLLNSYRITSPKITALKLYQYKNLNDALKAL